MSHVSRPHRSRDLVWLPPVAMAIAALALCFLVFDVVVTRHHVMQEAAEMAD